MKAIASLHVAKKNQDNALVHHICGNSVAVRLIRGCVFCAESKLQNLQAPVDRMESTDTNTGGCSVPIGRFSEEESLKGVKGSLYV